MKTVFFVFLPGRWNSYESAKFNRPIPEMGQPVLSANHANGNFLRARRTCMRSVQKKSVFWMVRHLTMCERQVRLRHIDYLQGFLWEFHLFVILWIEIAESRCILFLGVFGHHVRQG